jgi:hypothetical protein
MRSGRTTPVERRAGMMEAKIETKRRLSPVMPVFATPTRSAPPAPRTHSHA